MRDGSIDAGTGGIGKRNPASYCRRMFFDWLKQFMPRGIYGRAALILIVPVVSIQLVVSVAFIQRHFNRITVQMTSAVVVEIDYLARQVDAAPDTAAARRAIVPLLEPLALVVELPAEVPAARIAACGVI